LTLGTLGDFGRVLFRSGLKWFIFAVLDDKLAVSGGKSLWFAVFESAFLSNQDPEQNNPRLFHKMLSPTSNPNYYHGP
jgi:hypothetical protein